jgi:hypothetical protein
MIRDPYAKRSKPRQLLRDSNRQPDNKLPKSSKGSYDISDPYLRGRAGGEAHPNYIRGGGKAKR